MTTMGIVSGFESLGLVGTIRLDSGWLANGTILALSCCQTTTPHRSPYPSRCDCCTGSGCGCCYGGSGSALVLAALAEADAMLAATGPIAAVRKAAVVVSVAD